MLYYRTDLMPEAPTDWDGLTAAAQGAMDAGATYGINLQPGQTGAWQTFMPFAWQAGAEIVNEDATEFTFDTPEFVEALAKYQSFFTEGLAPTDLPQGSLEPDFMAGKIGSFVSGPWHVGILRDLDEAGMATSRSPRCRPGPRRPASSAAPISPSSPTPRSATPPGRSSSG